MGKMFVELENSNNVTEKAAFDDAEPMRSKAAIASYRCKLYRAQLEQWSAFRNPTPRTFPPSSSILKKGGAAIPLY
jgi:hypothetical protein